MTTTNHSTAPKRNSRFTTLLVAALGSLVILAHLTPAQAQPMTWQYGYDAMGRPTTVVDPNGQASYT